MDSILVLWKEIELHFRDVTPLSLSTHDRANETELSKNKPNLENIYQKQKPK